MKSINPNIGPRHSRKVDLEQLKAGILASNKTLLAQAITLAESSRSEDLALKRELLDWAGSHAKPSYRIGITGVPGAGKSTLIEALGLQLVNEHRVAVLAIDPSSQKTAGSILGDKTRMIELGRHPRAFIRPSPAGNTLGGVASRTREAIALCEAAGFNIILIETVGVGQSEVSVKQMVDFFLLVLIAGAGDELQGMKRGIVEMADFILINKADGDNKERASIARADYNRAISLFPMPASGIKPKVKTCSALNGDGLKEAWKHVEAYFKEIMASSFFDTQRHAQAVEWMRESINSQLLELFYHKPEINQTLQEFTISVKNGSMHPLTASNKLLKHFLEH